MTEEPQRGDPDRPRGSDPLAYLGLGVELVSPMIVGVLGGLWLDRRFETEPWLTVIGAVLGMAAGFLQFFRRVLPRKGPGNDGSGS